MTKIISLGGVGGCDLATTLRELNQEAYPYDWMITSQTFVMDSFNQFDRFFEFDEQFIYVHPTMMRHQKNLLTRSKNAIMNHDFKKDFHSDVKQVVEKYKRRFARLQNTLQTEDVLWFVRIQDNTTCPLYPPNYYDEYYIREPESITKWDHFMDTINRQYKIRGKLLLISDTEVPSEHVKHVVFVQVTNTEKQNTECLKKIITTHVL